MNLKFYITLVILVFTKVGFSQNSSIKGKVIDEKTGETLPGAVVLIKGTTIGGNTDLDGAFSINNLSPGTYSIRCQLISYNTKELSGIVVKSGEPTIISISMQSASTELGPVVIYATIDKETNSNLVNLQKNNASLSDGISSESIKRSPDKSTSDVLKRVSGASIQDNKFVIIRGLSDRYNAAMINGLPLPSTEPDRKAFAFDIFPSNMLDNMIIYKTASPDLPGDFAGGVVQINTKDIPEENFISLSAGAGYNSQSTFKEYKTYKGGKTDWLGRDDGSRALPNELPGTEEYILQLQNTTTRYEASKLFQNDWEIDSKKSSPLAQSYQLSLGGNKKVFKNDFGVIGALTYNNNRKLQIIERADFNPDLTELFSYTDNVYKENILWGGMLNFAYKLGENHKLSFKNMYSNNSEDAVIERAGKNDDTQQYIRATSMQFTSNSLLSSQLSGDHLLTKYKIKVKWGVSYNNTKRVLPDLRRMYYYKNIIPNDLADTLYNAYVPVGAPSNAYAGKFFSRLEENLRAAYLEVGIPFNILKQKQLLKIGGVEQFKNRSFDARVFGYVVNNIGLFDWSLLTKPQEELFDEKNIGPNGFKIAELKNPANNYNATSNLTAGYILLDNAIGKKTRIVWGARVENYHLLLNSKSYGGALIEIDTTFLDVLPSFNLTYSLTGKINLRLAGSKTLARPEFRELAPFSFYDFSTSSLVIGNSALVGTSITNADFRFEWYPGSGQIFSASTFYKKFKNPIEQIIDLSSGAGSRAYTYQNALSATNYGFELEMRFKLNLLDTLFKTKQFDHFTFFTNYTFIRSEIDLSNQATAVTEDEKHRPMQGQSPYVVNIGLQYLNNDLRFLKISNVYVFQGLGVSLLYNKIGRRIFLVGSNGYFNVYEAPRDLFDIQISLKLFKNGELKFNINDVFNQVSVFYQDQDGSKKFEADRDTQISAIRYGTNYSLSLSYKF
jgi:outer membrane receptor protein involved in Fe transport